MKKNLGQPVAAGFTLIEMLVVIAIIALLAGLLLPSLMHARDIAKRNGDKAILAALDRACEAFAEENKGQYPVSAAWTFDASNKLDHHVVRKCSDNSTLAFGGSGNPAYPGACLLFDRLARNIDDATGNQLIGKSKTDRYEVGNLKTVQMKHPTKTGVLVDAYYFVDSFGNPILYYNFCVDSFVDNKVNAPRYWDEHNPADAVSKANKITPPAAIDLPKQNTPALPAAQPVPLAPTKGAPYSMRWNPKTGAYEYWRGRTKTDMATNAVNGSDFILISPGKDGKYVAASANPADVNKGPDFKFDSAADDVTNLSR